MRYYFRLNYNILIREITHFGVNPYLGLILGVFAFVFASELLWVKSVYFPYIFCILGLYISHQIHSQTRILFVKNLFSKIDFYKIRCIETVLILIPFLGILLYHKCLYLAMILIIVSVVSIFININISSNRAFPTPFFKIPFESIIGFRKYILAIGFAYFIEYKAIEYLNFNLAIGAMMLLILIQFSYYILSEPPFYVWIYSLSPIGFLKQKYLHGIIAHLILNIVLIIAISIRFPSQIHVVLLLNAIFMLYFLVLLLLKYSAFPRAIQLPEIVVLLLSILFFPILIFVIPYLFKKSRATISSYLS